MIDEHGLASDERALMLAATMVETMRERHNLDDAEMDVIFAIALQVVLWALGGSAEARKIVLDATGKLSAVVAQIDDARDRRTEH